MGGAGISSGDGGGGGAGGWGTVIITGFGYSGTVTAALSGGHGGDGGASPLFIGGSGGTGGTGFYLESTALADLTVLAPIRGGNGGNGGDGGLIVNSPTPRGGNGGAGGTGLELAGGNTVLFVNNAVTGGNGGTAGNAYADGVAGAGGAGIVGADLVIFIDPGGSVAGGLANGGAGQRANAITFTGGQNTITFDSPTANLTGNIGLAGTSSLAFTQSANNTLVENAIVGTGSVRKSGSAVVTLAGDNTYTGTTTVSAGTLAAGAVDTFSAASAFTVLGGSILDLAGFDQEIASLAGDGVVINSGGADAVLTVGGDNSSTLFSGSLQDGPINALALGLTKVGTGTLTLSGNNLYSGPTTVSAGTLNIAGDWAGSLDSDYFVDTGATLSIADDVSAGIGSLADGQGGGGNVVIGATSDATVLFVVGTGVTSTFSGQIGGAGSLEVLGGSLTLTGASAIGGDLIVGEDATVAITGAGASFVTGTSRLSVTAVTGTLDITEGADLDSDLLFIGGEMTVDGFGTTATITDGPTFVGLASTASKLTISGGAVMESQGGAIVENPLVAAAVIVTDGGSTWNVGQFLAVGNVAAGGTGGLTVSAGGVVNVTGGTFIAADTVATGLDASSVLVTGQDSRLSTEGLEIGSDSCLCGDLAGELTVADRGVVEATEPVTIGALGILNIGAGGLAGTLNAPSIDNGGQIVADFTDTAVLDVDISGIGSLSKGGTGTLVLTGSNSFTGGTTVDAGTLLVGDAAGNGTLGGIVHVGANGTLGGSGTLTGSVTVDGTLSAGNSPGTLTFDDSLTLQAGSTSLFELNSPGIVGGTGAAGNDLVVVNGNLTLGGALEAHVAAAGYYRLFDYGSGTLSGSFTGGSLIGTGGFAPASQNNPDIRYDIPGQVNLSVLGQGQTMQFWDGNNAGGGDGTWEHFATNWINDSDGNHAGWGGSVGVFRGSAGTVNVSGAQSFDTLQFSTDGYVLTGGALEIGVAGGGTFNVDGGVTATIGSAIRDGLGSALLKYGNGTLVLTGNNTYSGGTSLLGGVISVSADASLGAAGGGLNFDGGVLRVTGTAYTSTARAITLGALGGGFDIADAANDFTLAQDIAGSGDLVKQGAGTLILTGTNAYGDTLVEAGTLIGNAASISGDIGNAATVVFDQAANASFAGRVLGLNGTDGAMIKRGAGVLTLDGVSTLDWTIEAGGLVTAGDRFGGDADLWAGTALTFDQAQAATYAGTLTGTGDLSITGAGSLTLTGDSSAFAGTTTVTGNSLIVGQNGSGALGGDMIVQSGGWLGGTGDIGSAGSTVTIASGAVHSPGNSIGVQNILGDYANHGTLRIEATPTAADRIVVAGSVDITGATLDLVLSPNGAASWDVFNGPFTIIDNQSLTAVAGTFSPITQNLLFLNASVAYDGGDGNDVTLALARNDTSFASIGRTRNQIATGTAIESLGNANPLWASIAMTNDQDVVRSSFDALSGEIHASAKTALVEESRFVRDAINDRIRAAFGNAGASSTPVLAYGPDQNPVLVSADDAGPVFWSQGFGSWGTADGDGNAASMDRSTGGLLIGTDGTAGDWRIGLVAGYSHSRFESGDRASSGTSDNYHLGLYGGTSWGLAGGDLALRAGAAYTWHDIDTSRSVAIPGVSNSLSAGYNAGTFQAFGELGYGIGMGDTRFEPFANLAYVSFRNQGFAEQGGAAALNGGNATANVTFTTLGLRAEHKLALGSIDATLRGMAGWRHAFGDTTSTTAMRFAAGGDAFTIAGTPIARNSAVVEAGLDLNFTPDASFGLSYTGQFAGSAQDHGFTARLRVQF